MAGRRNVSDLFLLDAWQKRRLARRCYAWHSKSAAKYGGAKHSKGLAAGLGFGPAAGNN